MAREGAGTMSALDYLYVFLGSILFMWQILTGEILFSLRYRRKQHFARRLILSCLAALPFVALISLLYAWSMANWSVAVNSVVVVVTYLFMFLLSLFILRCIYSESWRIIMTCGVAGYATQHLIVNFFNILRLYTDLYSFAFRSPLTYLLFLLIQIAVFAAGFAAVYFIFCRRANRYAPVEMVRGRAWALYVITLVVTLACNGVRDYFMAESAGLYTLCCIFSAMCCSFILIVRAGLFEQDRLKQENAIALQLMRSERKQFELTKESVELINVKCHDIRRQLTYFQSKQMPMSEEDLAQISGSIAIYDSALQTGNEILDVILMERSLYCREHGIRLTCSVDGKKLSFMSDADVSSLFGNALENAIEASVRLPQEDKRMVSIVVREAVGQLSVLVENYFAGEVAFEDGLPKTSKEDVQYHGWGTKSMRMIVEKYGGTLSFETAGEVFRMMAIIPLP